MSKFDSSEAKNILKNPKLEQELACIKSNYKIIVSTITLLQRQEINLCVS